MPITLPTKPRPVWDITCLEAWYKEGVGLLCILARSTPLLKFSFEDYLEWINYFLDQGYL